MKYPTPLANLIESYQKLPGIGDKTAIRLAFFTLGMSEKNVMDFSKNLANAKHNLNKCKICGNITEDEICEICEDKSRNQEIILVVEQIPDVMTFERMNDFNGLYHVLGGVLSPIEGTGPEDINIESLIKRLKNSPVKEIILATNPTPDGEATAMYIGKLLNGTGIKTTRLAHGLSMGSDIEYADAMTLSKAISGRREIE